MTVKELIEKLQAMPQDGIVVSLVEDDYESSNLYEITAISAGEAERHDPREWWGKAVVRVPSKTTLDGPPQQATTTGLSGK